MLRRRTRLLTSLLAIVAVASALCQAIGFVEAPHAAKAAASPATGTAGMFVPLQGRLADSRTSTNLSKLKAGVFQSLQIEGAMMNVGYGNTAQIPATGVSSVMMSVTSVNQSGGGNLWGRPDGSSAVNNLMIFSKGSTMSNSAIVAVADDGKIDVGAQYDTDLIVDIEGYYTDGNGDAAPGGFVPMTSQTIANTATGDGSVAKAPVAPGSTLTIQTGGVKGIPANASAVFVNITAYYASGTAAGYITPYPSGTTPPAGGLVYPGGTDPYAMGTQVSLGSDGAFKLVVGSGGSTRNWVVSVQGYFLAGSSTGAFTPAATRLYDSRVSPNHAVPANTNNAGTATIQIGGVKGVPLAGAGVSAVVMSVTTITAGSGYLRMWGSKTPEPNTSSVSYDPNRMGTVTNLVTVPLGPDGAITVRNVSTTATNVVLDLQGWYGSVGSAITSGQTQTQQSLTLQADPAGGGSWVTYQYRNGTAGSFANVPVGDVKDKDGNKPSAWPVQKNGSSFTAYTWNIRDTLAALPGNNGVGPDALLQVQACFGTSSTDNSPVCNMPSNVNFSQNDGGNATTDIGPGTLSELTGNFTISESDADAATALGSLSVGRGLTTLHPAAGSSTANGVFGPGWTANFPAPSGGSAEYSLSDNSDQHYILLTDADGYVTTYVDATGSSTYPMTFRASGDDSGDGSVMTKVDGNTITKTEADGTTTTWQKSGSPATWRTVAVAAPGSNSTTSYSYNGAGLVSRILAPVPDGVSCSTDPDHTAGCRSLILTYTTTGPTRLDNVAISVPQGTSSDKPVPVAQYDYDSGRLAHAWDPRTSPALKTAYTYTSDNRLSTLTPPGMSPWSFTYDATGRLASTARPDPSGKNAVETVVYDVDPLGPSGDVIDLNKHTPADWGQRDDLPVTGTAVFGPDRVPTADPRSNLATADSVTADDWPFASIDFLDVNGRVVDSANYGNGAWQIGASGFDASGNELWTLTPGNRMQALTTTAETDSYVASLGSSTDRAAKLTSTTTYDPLHPGQVTDKFGPTHAVVLASGATIHARTHVSTTYDEGAPNNDVDESGDAYGLPTTITTSAYRVDNGTPGDTAGGDSYSVHNGYEALQAGDKSGWDLAKATTKSIAVSGSGDLVTKTRYDDKGRIIEIRLPGDANGDSSRTTIMSYYAAAGSGPCVDAARTGLVCTEKPAAQPSSGPPIPVTSYTYDKYGNTASKVETYGDGANAIVRTTAISYDDAERQSSSAVTVSPTSAGGSALPVVTTSYTADSGLPATTSTTVGSQTTSITHAYDKLGQVVSYTDATGNKSTTSYDPSGNVTAKNDGKQSTTYSVNSADEHRGLVVGEDLGTVGSLSAVSASYNADGALATLTYPNGLKSRRQYDNAGNVTALTYSKDGATWMTFTQDFNALGFVADQTSPQSSQKFAYDSGDRLTSVQDTFQNACTVRSYAYDTHSNRTSLTTSNPGSGSQCTSGGSTTSYSYDAGDRLTSDAAGTYSYDSLGRTTVTPAGDAAGGGAHAAFSGDLSSTYYANDLIASQTQGGEKISVGLDPLQSRTLVSTESPSSGAPTTTTNHYDDNTDSPSWSSTGSTSWTRYVPGVTGGLMAVAKQTGEVSLQLVNLHGDIVATCDDLSNVSSFKMNTESTEFGVSRSRTTQPIYGYLGQAQRSGDALGGQLVMGVRQYLPTTGRFLSPDPVTNGNANSYIYPCDPINNVDTSGKKRHHIDPIVLQIRAADHNRVMLRAGRLGHVQSLHGLDEYTIAAALRNAYTWYPHPKNAERHTNYWVYKAHARKTECGWGWTGYSCDTETNHVVVIVSRSMYGDHHRFGVVTAYCDGVDRCPDWVNDSFDGAIHTGVIKHGP